MYINFEEHRLFGITSHIKLSILTVGHRSLQATAHLRRLTSAYLSSQWPVSPDVPWWPIHTSSSRFFWYWILINSQSSPWAIRVPHYPVSLWCLWRTNSHYLGYHSFPEWSGPWRELGRHSMDGLLACTGTSGISSGNPRINLSTVTQFLQHLLAPQDGHP